MRADLRWCRFDDIILNGRDVDILECVNTNEVGIMILPDLSPSSNFSYVVALFVQLLRASFISGSTTMPPPIMHENGIEGSKPIRFRHALNETCRVVPTSYIPRRILRGNKPYSIIFPKNDEDIFLLQFCYRIWKDRL